MIDILKLLESKEVTSINESKKKMSTTNLPFGIYGTIILSKAKALPLDIKYTFHRELPLVLERNKNVREGYSYTNRGLMFTFFKDS